MEIEENFQENIFQTCDNIEIVISTVFIIQENFEFCRRRLSAAAKQNIYALILSVYVLVFTKFVFESNERMENGILNWEIMRQRERERIMQTVQRKLSISCFHVFSFHISKWKQSRQEVYLFFFIFMFVQGTEAFLYSSSFFYLRRDSIEITQNFSLLICKTYLLTTRLGNSLSIS